MATSVSENLSSVLDKIEKARNESGHSHHVRLVAVSKTKPAESIIEAYKAGQRHFGENYVQELEEKAQSELIRTECPEIKWHLIGHLQSNKAKKVAALSNLYAVETVDSFKLAEILNSTATTLNKKINVFVQVNTSGEEQKSGVAPSEAIGLYKEIRDKCSNLTISGLMTIGSYEQSTTPGQINIDFQRLIECKTELVKKLDLNADSVEISMGMSHDFEEAVRMGSTNVRVGSLIFGSR